MHVLRYNRKVDVLLVIAHRRYPAWPPLGMVVSNGHLRDRKRRISAAYIPRYFYFPLRRLCSLVGVCCGGAALKIRKDQSKMRPARRRARARLTFPSCISTTTCLPACLDDVAIEPTHERGTDEGTQLHAARPLFNAFVACDRPDGRPVRAAQGEFGQHESACCNTCCSVRCMWCLDTARVSDDFGSSGS